MQSFFIRSLVVFFVTIVQLSFIQTIFPGVSPNLALMASVSWVLLMGFVRAWPWVVGLGLLMDILSFKTVGVMAIMLLVSAYMASFFSKRLTVGHQGIGFGVMAVFVLGLSFIFRSAVFLAGYIQAGGHDVASGEMLGALARNGGWILVGDLILFFLVYGCLARIEHRLGFYESPLTIKR